MSRSKLWTFGRKPEGTSSTPSTGPDWKQANPRSIQRSLDRALARPSGAWFVVDASRRITSKPSCYRILDRALVAWRDGDSVRIGPNECPHMGAELADGPVVDGKLMCPWHGLALGDRPHGSWKPLKTHDDGVLVWVRIDDTATDTDPVTEAPIIAPRPASYIEGVIRVEARCEPADVIANRLDPWHGVHFHPYSFGRLTVLDSDEDVLKVRVAKRVLGPLAIEVDATFHSPDPRTIVMTITSGEGAGSVVETHATPISDGRTAIIEATIATSDRFQFALARMTPGLVRPFIERSAKKLWRDDAAYAERLYQLRSR